MLMGLAAECRVVSHGYVPACAFPTAGFSESLVYSYKEGASQMGEFVQVAKLSEIQPGQHKAFWVEGQKILVFNIEGTLYAVDESCPHRECSLSKGKLNGKVITCPCHYAQFDLETGEALVQPTTNPPTGPLPVQKVKVEGGNIFVAIQEDADFY
jgi:nitrite reductase/ring-hydroxylating ferredoxin subunit/rubredoxin